MRIAATLAGAVLAALLLLPAAARAESAPSKPRVMQTQEFGDPGAAGVTGEPQVTRDHEESALLVLKKRKKPQFQTRFFGE